VRKHGGLPDVQREDEVDVYDHLVIDEAQDFGAVELDVLFSVVRSRTGITVVGDTNQKIVPSADFIGWDALARELGLDAAAVSQLEVAHRSTAPIMAVANTLTGDPTGPGRPGPMPRLHRTDSPERVRELLVTEVARLAQEHEHGHVAVVTRSRRAAQELAPVLAGELRGVVVRHGHNKSFAFEPGVTVTNMAQVKGLEFDAVVVLEPDASAYPADGQDGRRWLYTVCTRAKSDLVFIVRGEPTPLLAPAIEQKLIEVADDAVVPEFQGDDEPF
jgi:DNA helicase IV